MIKDLIKTLIDNPVLANVTMILLIMGGIVGGHSMIREIFPKFSLDIISVSVAYPGADPEEVEEGVCIKLEEAVDGIEGIKKITSSSSEGSGTVLIECEDGVDVEKIKDEIKTEVDSINTFPPEAESPVVKEEKFRGNVLSIMLWGDLPERQFKELAREIESEILNIKGVSQSTISGIRDYQISIEISEEKLRKYSLSFEQVSSAIAKNATNLPSGAIKTDVEDFRIRAIGRRYRAKEYRDIPIVTRSDGTIVTLGKIARIRDDFDDTAGVFYSYFNGKPAVSIDIYKTESEDSINISNLVDQYIKRKQAALPPNIHLTKFTDRSELIEDRLDMLTRNGRVGLVLVFLTLWLFLNLRLSFWVSMGIPISIAGALAIMAMAGCTINMLSMFGLIMVLGIIVDDAIVIGESIYARRYAGDGPHEAAINGTCEVAWPVIAAVVTTIVAFLPLFFIPGVMGKFIVQIPIPVISALGISLVEGLFILPVHLRHLRKFDSSREIPHNPTSWDKLKTVRRKITSTLEHFIENIYAPFLEKVLHWRYITLCLSISLLLIVGGMVKGRIISFIFVERDESDQVRVRVEMSPGTPVSHTKAVSDKVLAAWEKTRRELNKKMPKGKDISRGVYTLVGGVREHGRKWPQPAKFEVTVSLLPSQIRNMSYRDILKLWKKNTGDIPGAISTEFKARRGGPGGLPVEIQLLGEDMNTLLRASDELMAQLRSYSGTFDEQIDYRPGKREFVISIKPNAYQYGLTLKDIARHVKSGFYGNEAISVQRGRDDVDIKVRYPEKSGRDSVEYFEKLRIVTPKGLRVPFKNVAEIKLQEGASSIKRINRKRTVVVSCDVDESIANSDNIRTDLENNFLPKLMAKYSITYSTEGEKKQQTESLGSLRVGFPLAMLAIYFIIASIFGSYIQPVIIMTTIPFGLIGAIFGHVLFGRSISIMSMFGMVALAGIVVNDAIVLIEGINLRMTEGMPLFVAIREGAKRRFRPIMLTTMTTFAGLTPLLLERSMQARFLIPMAISISFGVLFATLLTLILIPCLLGILNDLRRVFHYLWFLEKVSREEVEPRSKLRIDRGAADY